MKSFLNNLSPDIICTWTIHNQRDVWISLSAVKFLHWEARNFTYYKLSINVTKRTNRSCGIDSSHFSFWILFKEVFRKMYVHTVPKKEILNLNKILNLIASCRRGTRDTVQLFCYKFVLMLQMPLHTNNNDKSNTFKTNYSIIKL